MVATEIPGKSYSGHNENCCACQIGGLSTPVGEADTADQPGKTKTDIEGHIPGDTSPICTAGLLKRHEQTGSLYTAGTEPKDCHGQTQPPARGQHCRKY